MTSWIFILLGHYPAFFFAQFPLKGKNCWQHPLRDTPSSPWADKTVLQTLQAPESTVWYHIATPMAETQSHLYKSSVSLVRTEVGQIISNVKALEIKCREVWVPRRKSYFIAQMADWPFAAEHYVRICIFQQPRQEKLHYVDSTSALLYNNLVNTFCDPPWLMALSEQCSILLKISQPCHDDGSILCESWLHYQQAL